MKIDWSPVLAEQDRWRQAGLVLPLWWRDDDAVAPSPALDRLDALAQAVGMAVHLAVVPASAIPALGARVAAGGRLIPVVHGWAHRNHAPAGRKKSEFGAERPAAAALADMRRGLARLRDVFGAGLVPMFVPPWNRIAGDLAARLAPLGYRGLSTFGPRRAPLAATGLVQVNTHLDPIDWHGGRGLLAPEMLVARLAGLLRDRRLGRADNDEPLGLLTHHLVHDADIWEFSQQVLAVLLAGPAQAAALPLAPTTNNPLADGEHHEPS